MSDHAENFEAGWLQVVNGALLKIGLPLADNLTDADYNAKIRLEHCLKQVFRAFPWGFAMKYVSLEENTSRPVFGWQHGYTFPSDYIRLIDVYGKNDIHAPKVPFCISDGLICCNANPAYARYIAYIKDVSKWPCDFEDAVSCLLAAEIAPLSAQTQAMTPSLIQQYQWKLVSAQNIDSTETTERVPMDEDIYMARTGQATQH